MMTRSSLPLLCVLAALACTSDTRTDSRPTGSDTGEQPTDTTKASTSGATGTTGDTGTSPTKSSFPTCAEASVVHISSDGATNTDVSSTWEEGVVGAPASVALEAGTYSVCAGEYNVNLTVPSKLSVVLVPRDPKAASTDVVLTATQGTVVLIEQESELELSRMQISGASTGLWVDDGCRVVVTDVVFRDNEAIEGAAIHNEAGSPTDDAIGLFVTGSTFDSNSTTSHGGALWTGAGSRTEVSTSTFIRNESLLSGGAISSQGLLTLDTITFDANTANRSGGAIRMIAGEISANDCEFTENTAQNSGGAGYVTGESTLSITTATITDNSVTAFGSDGGAFHIDQVGARLDLVDATVNRNSAVHAGGAFLVTGAAALQVTGAILKDNEAVEGGAFFSSVGSNQSNGTATFESCTFDGNEATQDGGALYVSGGYLVLEDTLVTDNTAGDEGGGLYVAAGRGTGDATCRSTGAAKGRVGFIANGAVEGGAVRTYSPHNVRFESDGCDFGETTLEDNSPDDVDWYRTPFNAGNGASFVCDAVTDKCQ